MDGLINLYKEAGATSFRQLSALRRILGEKKLGHAGTLDPMATGVLPICLGKGTRCSEFFLTFPKRYIAEMTFGLASDTGDVWGKVRTVGSCTPVSREKLEKAINSFTGEITQVPPSYSALKVNGVPAYKRARMGETPALKERAVTIYEIKMLNYEWPRAVIEVKCSRGTYIRTLCEDIAFKLSMTAVMSALERIEYGSFNVNNAYTLSDIKDICNEVPTERIEEHLREQGVLQSIDSVLGDLPKLALESDKLDDYLHGRKVMLDIENIPMIRVYDGDNNIMGIARSEDGRLLPMRSLR